MKEIVCARLRLGTGRVPGKCQYALILVIPAAGGGGGRLGELLNVLGQPGLHCETWLQKPKTTPRSSLGVLSRFPLATRVPGSFGYTVRLVMSWHSRAESMEERGQRPRPNIQTEGALSNT